MVDNNTNEIEKAQKGDKDAMAFLVEKNQGLIWSIVKRFTGRGYETEDLYQIGCIGFIKSIRNFDIQFEVKLDYGDVSEKITDKHADYIALFDYEKFPFDEPVEECLRAIFKNIDIRTQEQLVKKAMIAHKLLYNDKKDYSFMCMELLLAVMICVYNDNSCFSKTPINIIPFDKIFTPLPSTNRPAFADFFVEKFIIK